MATDSEIVEGLIVNALRWNNPMSKETLIYRVAMDFGDRADEELIEKIIEKMADRMIILEMPSGKYGLNEE